MNRKIVVIDTSAVLHAVKHGMASTALSSGDEYTFIIFGFLHKLRLILNKDFYHIPVFALDSVSESVRRDFFPDYKKKRQENKTEKQIALDKIAVPQFKVVTNEILPTVGWKNCIRLEGFEADDIIAKICKNYKNDYVTIVTTDQDMYQLLNDNVSILHPQKMNFYTVQDFRQEYGIEPADWKKVKVYGGCKSDNVPGLPVPEGSNNIAEKGAINYILGKTKPHHKAYKAFTCEENKSIIARNKSLVILPHRRCPDVRIVPDHLTREGIDSIVEKYNFKSMKHSISEFYRVFKIKV